MTFSRIALMGCVLGALGGAQAIPYDNATEIAYTTKVVTAVTTFCPGPTTLTHGDKTYTITSATTLTITDCPCTVTEPHPKPTNPGECEWLCKQDYNECVGTKPNNRNCVLEEDSCKAACPVHSTKSVKPAPKPTVHPGECEFLCEQDYNECVGTKPNNRNCVLEEDSCKAACPGSSSVPVPKPTGSALTTKPAPKPTSNPGECEWLCKQDYNECVGTKPNSRNCVMEEDSCKSACGGQPTPTPVPVNSAGRICANILLALGAAALI
ncbi:hypothetical protein ACHAPJ_013110 [Fusarium lateritium]